MTTARLSSGERRGRTLARTLHARLFATADGRILVLRGQPSLPRLRSCLARLEKTPSPADAPAPPQLGLFLRDGELTPPTLHSLARALKQWRAELDAPLQSRRKRQLPRNVRDGERQEIERLESRLAACYRWSDTLQKGTAPTGAPYLLDDAAEQLLAAELAEWSDSLAPSAHVAWLARVVFWLSGAHSLRRYLQAVAPIVQNPVGRPQTRQVRQFVEQLGRWKERAESEPVKRLHAEIVARLKAMPDDAVKEAQLSRRLRRRGLAEHCDLLLARSRTFLEKYARRNGASLPGELAAFCAADGGAAPFPVRTVLSRAGSYGYRAGARVFDLLMREVGKPGYDQLLTYLADASPAPPPGHYDSLRRIFARGGTFADAAWSLSRVSLWRIADSCFKPASLRRFVERLGELGIGLSNDQLDTFLEGLALREDGFWVDRWLAWLKKMPVKSADPRLQRLVATAFLQLYMPAIRQEGSSAVLLAWLNPPAAPRQGSCAVGDPQLTARLNQLAAYQQLAGKTPALPRGLQRLLDQPERERREYAFLRGALDSDPTNQSLQQRIGALQERIDGGWRLNEPRLLRLADEALLTEGVEALRQLLQRAAHQAWQSVAGVALPPREQPRVLKFAQWLGQMTAEQRQLLRETLAAWTEHGDDYKRHLPRNRPWLAATGNRGFDPRVWLRPPGWTTYAGSSRVRIVVASDPWQCFAMGDQFGTCLSLGGCNEMSILANAHDANKQVVYMIEEHAPGRPRIVARQLLGISTDGKLLGYRCYVAYDKRERERRAHCIATLAEYGGRLASLIGLPLGKEGAPEVLCGGFWYDDTPFAWHPAAQSAWEREESKRKAAAAAELYNPPNFALPVVLPPAMATA